MIPVITMKPLTKEERKAELERRQGVSRRRWTSTPAVVEPPQVTKVHCTTKLDREQLKTKDCLSVTVA